mgnify:CR=1 FL=1
MRDKTIKTRSHKGEADSLDKIISDSYNDFIRMERRNLLAASSITLISFVGDVNPKDLKIIGFEFPNINISILFVLLSIACLYFLVAFIIYAYPGYREASKQWAKISENTITMTGQFSWLPAKVEDVLSTARYKSWLIFNYFLIGVSLHLKL